MMNHGGNYYKICRQMAGLTQEEAADRLHTSVRSLAAYEAEEGTKDKRTPPDDIVAAMAEAYGTSLLAWWHIRTTSCLGKYLPDVQLPASAGDMGFQTVLTHTDVARAEALIMTILADGAIEPDEHDDLCKYRDTLHLASARLLSAKTYVDDLLNGGSL